MSTPVLCSALIALMLAACDMDNSTTADAGPSSTDINSNQSAATANTEPERYDQNAALSAVSAISHIHADEGYSVSGDVRFHPDAEGLRITGELNGLSPGQHGFHIHEFGDCSAPDRKSAGGHFAPNGNRHGGPQDAENQRHAGDLGNVDADQNGRASIDILNTELKLSEGSKAIIGKSVIVHAGRDDFTSQPAGDAGARVGCGVIEQTPPSS